MFRRITIASCCPVAVSFPSSSSFSAAFSSTSLPPRANLACSPLLSSHRRWCSNTTSTTTNVNALPEEEEIVDDEEEVVDESEHFFAPAVGANASDRSDVCITAPDLDEIESDTGSWYVVTQRPDKNLVAAAVDPKVGRQLLVGFGGFGAQLPINEEDGTVRVFSVPDRLGWDMMGKSGPRSLGNKNKNADHDNDGGAMMDADDGDEDSGASVKQHLRKRAGRKKKPQYFGGLSGHENKDLDDLVTNIAQHHESFEKKNSTTAAAPSSPPPQMSAASSSAPAEVVEAKEATQASTSTTEVEQEHLQAEMAIEPQQEQQQQQQEAEHSANAQQTLTKEENQPQQEQHQHGDAPRKTGRPRGRKNSKRKEPTERQLAMRKRAEERAARKQAKLDERAAQKRARLEELAARREVRAQERAASKKAWLERLAQRSREQAAERRAQRVEASFREAYNHELGRKKFYSRKQFGGEEGRRLALSQVASWFDSETEAASGNNNNNGSSSNGKKSNKQQQKSGGGAATAVKRESLPNGGSILVEPVTGQVVERTAKKPPRAVRTQGKSMQELIPMD